MLISCLFVLSMLPHWRERELLDGQPVLRRSVAPEPQGVLALLEGEGTDPVTLEQNLDADEMEGGLSMEDFLKANEPALETTGDVVSMAMILETQSLDLYLRYAHRMSGENAKEILYQLADQEKAHLGYLGRLMDKQTGTRDLP